MAKFMVLAVLLCFCSVSVFSEMARARNSRNVLPTTKPVSKETSSGDEWLDMKKACVTKMKEQIQKEINASFGYMAMAAHFSRDDVNMPGFAKIFFESAAEERDHAQHLIQYLLMRGPQKDDASFTKGLITPQKPDVTSWDNGLAALEKALEMEVSVTNSIRDVIGVCEAEAKKDNDYHLVDYLTGEFLEEQYQGQRVIAGRISTLRKMQKDHKNLAFFLYDKELLG